MPRIPKDKWKIAMKIKDTLISQKVHPRLSPQDVRFIFVGGSVARGLSARSSDVDIILVTERASIDKQEFRKHLKKFIPEADSNCVFVYSYEDFLKSLDERLTDGKITNKRMRSAIIKRFSRIIDKPFKSSVHRRASIFLRRIGLLRDNPRAYSLEEQASLIPIYEKNPGEWRKIIGKFDEALSDVFKPEGARRVIRRYLDGEISSKDARKELTKLPFLWKYDLNRLIKEGNFTPEEAKKLKKLLRGWY